MRPSEAPSPAGKPPTIEALLDYDLSEAARRIFERIGAERIDALIMELRHAIQEAAGEEHETADAEAEAEPEAAGSEPEPAAAEPAERLTWAGSERPGFVAKTSMGGFVILPPGPWPDGDSPQYRIGMLNLEQLRILYRKTGRGVGTEADWLKVMGNPRPRKDSIFRLYEIATHLDGVTTVEEAKRNSQACHEELLRTGAGRPVIEAARQ